jgi:hypothetical protein
MSVDEISSALDQCVMDGFIPTTAFVFISIKQDRKAIEEILQEKGIDIVGATSSGEFIEGCQEEGSAVMLSLDMPRDAYAIFFVDIAGRNLQEASKQLAKNALEQFRNPAFILCMLYHLRNPRERTPDIWWKVWNIRKPLLPLTFSSV